MNGRAFVTGLGAVLAAPLAAGRSKAIRNASVGFLGTSHSTATQE
jgi:hypothetical protein